MPNRSQRKIMQTRNILALAVIACVARLAKVLIDGQAETRQIVALIIITVILGVVLAFYVYIDRYTRKEQKNHDEPGSPAAQIPVSNQSANFKSIVKEIFKK